MTRRIRSTCLPVGSAAAITLMVFCVTRGAAQVPPQAPGDADAAKLDKSVTLQSGTVTVGRIVSDLSRETGLSIAAASAIKDRRVTVDLTGVTARQALDAIAAMYDWRWYRSEPGQYALDRPVFRTPSDPAAIPAAMQSALPVDMRTFLKLPDLKTKKPDYTSGAVMMSLGGVPFQALDRLKPTLADVFVRQDTLAVRDMAAGQRDDLLTWLTFGVTQKTLELLHDDPAPHKMNSGNITLRIEQKVHLFIGTTADVIPGFGFGAQIFMPDGRWVP